MTRASAPPAAAPCTACRVFRSPYRAILAIVALVASSGASSAASAPAPSTTWPPPSASAPASAAVLGVATAGAAISVSAQGRLIEETSSDAATSPEGLSVRLVPAGGDAELPRFELFVGLLVEHGGIGRRSLGVFDATGVWAAGRNRVVLLAAPEGGPARLRVLDAAGSTLLDERFGPVVSPALSADGRYFVFSANGGTEVLDLRALAWHRLPEMRSIVLDGNGLVAGVLTGSREGLPSMPEALAVFRVDPADAVSRPALAEEPGIEPLRVFRIRSGAPVSRVVFSAESRQLLVLTDGEILPLDLRTGTWSRATGAPRGWTLRDLRRDGDRVVAGLRRETDGTITGAIALLTTEGRWRGLREGPARETVWGRRPPRGAQCAEPSQGALESGGRAEPIPWPLAPDAQHPVGNTYGEYQAYGGAPYLHPGVDVMGVAGQPVYAVRSGQVKAILTTSGDWHWRIATADQAGSGTSEGYLYAHIDPATIAVDLGDLVAEGQYLGDLVEWPVAEFHHCHFARIRDTGTVWNGSWLCTGNPQPGFHGPADPQAPVFEPARGSDLFAFCRNETSQYLSPQSLAGEVDIIARVGDFILTDWLCAVKEIRYSIYRPGAPGWPAVENRQAVDFDMDLDMYQNGPMDPFLVSLLYKDDSTCDTRGDYDVRRFFHIITNSDGDAVYEEADRLASWDTRLLPDAEWTIRVEAVDAAGNITADSMQVRTVNGNTAAPEPSAAWTAGAHPNPFRSAVRLSLETAAPGPLRVGIFDASGREVRALTVTAAAVAPREIVWDGRDASGHPVPAGAYFYRWSGAPARAGGRIVRLH